MRHVTVSLDPHSIAAGRALAQRYGLAGSFSSVLRRAIALLEEHWEEIGSESEAIKVERGEMLNFLAKSRKGQGARVAS